eukprot:1184102-Rhodomonas_salina.2
MLCEKQQQQKKKGEESSEGLTRNWTVAGFIELREIQYAKEVAETIANSNFKVWPRRCRRSVVRIC